MMPKGIDVVNAEGSITEASLLAADPVFEISIMISILHSLSRSKFVDAIDRFAGRQLTLVEFTRLIALMAEIVSLLFAKVLRIPMLRHPGGT